MIRRKSLFCKIKKIKKPSIFLYTYSKDDVPDLTRQNCPACRAQGQYKSHGFYKRYVIDFYKGKPSAFQVCIQRVRCSCGHTHALLKDILIPYCQYTIRFILQVLKKYFRHSLTINEICQLYRISEPTLYRLKKIFLLHRELWIGLVRSREEQEAFFIQFIQCCSDLSDLLHTFFRKTGFSFLQSHANPAYS